MCKNMIAKKWFKMPFWFFNVLFSLLTVFVYNLPFLEKVHDTQVPCWILCTVALSLFAVFYAIYNLILIPPVTKWIAGFFMIANAIAFHFVSSYNIFLNKIMLLDVLETNAVEATDFIGWPLFQTVIVWGIIPLILMCKTHIVYGTVKQEIIRRMITIIVPLGIIAAIALPNKLSVKMYARENFSIRYQLLPTSYIDSLIKAIQFKMRSDVEFVDISKGLTVHRAINQSDKPLLVVFILGESARAANMSLNGYERDTNSPLKPFEKDIVSFQNVMSCGTVTRVAVPCLFSHLGREEYNADMASYTGNVLDLLSQSGYNIQWIDNELGCSNVCDRVETLYTCTHRDCYDSVLNTALFDKLKTVKTDSFIFLHQRGSHGSQYYKRYPQEYEKYTPVCQESDPNLCDYQELVNAYDNTLYYTSVVMADMMHGLQKMTDRFYPMVVFISDHGESLGEDGYFGHGSEYHLMPVYQKHVPFFVWMPQATQKELNIDFACLQQHTNQAYSQDNIFHSLLGIGGVTADVYDASLDIFEKCRIK